MKKKVAKQIRKVAENLPLIFNSTSEKHIVTGAELIEQNITEIDGVKVIPQRQYLQYMPVQIATNHHKALKQAYKKEGMKGIKHYSETAIAIGVAARLQQS